jgi:hypothetical protein
MKLRPSGTFSGAPNCFFKKKINLSQEKGAGMRFLKKLFGSVSNSVGKNDYARATLEYATSPKTFKSNAMVYSNRMLAFEAQGEYDRPVSGYARTPRIKPNNAIIVMNIGVAGSQKQRISVYTYRYFTSKTYLSISRC